MADDDDVLDRREILREIDCLNEKHSDLGASPPFHLIPDDGTLRDIYIGEYPIHPAVGRALVFCRAVHDAEDGFERGRLYVLMRFKADPTGEPVRLPIPCCVDEGIKTTVCRLLEINASKWGFDPADAYY